MTGSHEVRGSIPLSSTNKNKGLHFKGAIPFCLIQPLVPLLSHLFGPHLCGLPPVLVGDKAPKPPCQSMGHQKKSAPTSSDRPGTISRRNRGSLLNIAVHPAPRFAHISCESLQSRPARDCTQTLAHRRHRRIPARTSPTTPALRGSSEGPSRHQPARSSRYWGQMLARVTRRAFLSGSSSPCWKDLTRSARTRAASIAV